MARKKVKLAWIENDISRATSFKKRRLGLLKKIRELTILCDVKACMILFSLNEAMPMVWPSHEKVRDLLDGFFALPEMEKKKKETNLESYLKEKTKKVHEKLMKKHKKNMKNVINQLMVQLHRGRRIADLNVSEIYALISFSKDNIIHYRKRLDSVQHPPLRDPPVFPFEEFRTTTNNAFVGGVKEDERAWKTDVRENQSYYLMDQWVFASPKPPKPRTNQQTGIDMVSCSKNPNPNPNLEMEPVGPPVMTFHGSFGPVSQPLQHHSMISNPTMAMSTQPRQYPIDFMSRELEVKEEGSTVNNEDSEFHRRSNTTAVINDGIRQEPPANGTTDGEGNYDATSFDINKAWPEISKN